MREFRVTFGIGKVVKGIEVCKDVRVELAGHTISKDFYPLKLGIVYIILGMSSFEKKFFIENYVENHSDRTEWNIVGN